MTNAVNIAQGGSNNVTMRNRIINGAMVIDQRNAGASVSVGVGTSVYTVDRWQVENSMTTGVLSAQQSSSVAPVNQGFYNSLKLAVTTAQTSTAANVVDLVQKIEGFNVSDLAWGTANAKALTVSFWVYSSLTGTYCSTVRNTAGRSYTVEYSIPTANTWTQVSYTVPGDTTTAVAVDNQFDLGVYFDLGSGSNFNTTAGAWQTGNYRRTTNQANWIGTSSATFYITGVQLEAGTTASPFEYRQYGTELALCQRYAIVYGRDQVYNELGGTGFAYTGSAANIPVAFPVQMRSTPTLTTSGNFQLSDGATGYTGSGIAMTTGQSSTLIASVGVTASGLTVYRAYRLESQNSTASYALFSAEL